MPTLTTNGLELFYDTFGDEAGEPIVLVMGIGAQAIHWPEGFCRELADSGFRVIRFDHRDVGLSEKLVDAPVPGIKSTIAKGLFRIPINAPYTLSDMGADVAGLIEGLGYESAHLFGISMGGMVAQVVATEFPERVRTLTSMMSTTGARRFTGKPRAIKALFMGVPKTPEEAADNSFRFFTIVGGEKYPVDEADLRARSARAFERCSYPRGFVRHLVAIVASGNRTRALKKLETPTLVIHGSDDPLIPLSAGRATARAIPNARLHVIEGLGHHLPRAIWPELVEQLTTHTRLGEN